MRFKSILEQGIPFGITSLIYQEVLQVAKSEKEIQDVNKVSAAFERNWDNTCGLGRFLTNSLKIFVSSRYIIRGDFL